MKKPIQYIIFTIGIIFCIGAIIFLCFNIFSANQISIPERLLTVKTWVKDGAPSVIWTFTEPGKGTLTTNNHQNDYDFIWNVEGEKLKIETTWLYNLVDEYSIKLVGDNFSIFSYRTEEDSIFIPYQPTETPQEQSQEQPEEAPNSEPSV